MLLELMQMLIDGAITHFVIAFYPFLFLILRLFKVKKVHNLRHRYWLQHYFSYLISPLYWIDMETYLRGFSLNHTITLLLWHFPAGLCENALLQQLSSHFRSYSIAAAFVSGFLCQWYTQVESPEGWKVLFPNPDYWVPKRKTIWVIS